MCHTSSHYIKECDMLKIDTQLYFMQCPNLTSLIHYKFWYIDYYDSSYSIHRFCFGKFVIMCSKSGSFNLLYSRNSLKPCTQ